MTAFGRVALDGEEVPAPSNGDDWRLAWHPPPAAPPGEPHGANAFCVTADDDVVLISSDGARWGWPGGRPEPGESWQQTLEREILEEACARVTAARLLGFVREPCADGPNTRSRSAGRCQRPSWPGTCGPNRVPSRSTPGPHARQGSR